MGGSVGAFAPAVPLGFEHEKNFSFLMSPEGQWHLAPAYDLTFIIATNGIEPEKAHCMSIGGKYSDITTEDLIRLGRDTP